MDMEYRLMFLLFPCAFVVYLLARLVLPDSTAIWVGFASFVAGLSAVYVALVDSLAETPPLQNSTEPRSQEEE
jgi:hypothetical protein